MTQLSPSRSVAVADLSSGKPRVADRPRILFCSRTPLVEHLGASKVLIELAQEMRGLGWEADIVGPDALSARSNTYPLALRQYLIENAHRYDVVDYDHEALPFSRADFPSGPLLVARSVLLIHHLPLIFLPRLPGIRRALSQTVHDPGRRRQVAGRVRQAQRTVEQADLVNVSNDHDRAELLRHGIPPERLVVLPFGMSASRRKLFDQIPASSPRTPRVSFVGTFDRRKGAGDFPKIFASIARSISDVDFLLLGTRGLVPTAAEVRRSFPRRLRSRLEVHERFDPADLPYLLRGASVGIFPSYFEGFGFGVLEMLAASIPVIAYDAPGPPMMLPKDWLVPRGDALALGTKVINMLQDPKGLLTARARAKAISERFSWSAVARATSEIYMRQIAARGNV